MNAPLEAEGRSEALRQSARSLHRVFEALGDGFYEADLHGRFTFANRSLCQVLGRDEQEILGSRFESFAHPDDRQKPREAFRTRMLHGGAGKPFEFRINRGDGDVRHAEGSVAVILDSEERIVGFCGVVRDISSHKAIAAVLERYYVELEEARMRAEAQALQLARQAEELTQARNEALAATRVKSEFLANISHEIRTPLNGVIGVTELLLETNLTTEQREYLQMIRGSGNDLLTLINDLLDFSRIEAGKLDLDAIPFSLRQCVAETLKPLAVQAREKGLELVHEIEDQVPDTLIGDPSRLRQVVVNLVDNGIKFTARGEVFLRVLIEEQNGSRAVLRFDVTDTGIGIPTEKREAIFESFEQGDGSATREHGGTGLGLAISCRLAQMMGGRLRVESEVGAGSTFSFTTRFTVGRAELARHPFAPCEALKGLRVLVVEDHPGARDVHVSTLCRWGVAAEGSENGRPALETLRQAAAEGRPFRVVLLNDYRTACRIREDRDLDETRVVLLTLCGERGDAARCRNAGIAAYLVKPLAEVDLLDCIRAVVACSNDESRFPLITRHSMRESRRRLNVLVAEDNAVNLLLATKLLERIGHRVTAVPDGREAVNAHRRGEFGLILLDAQTPSMDGATAASRIRKHERGGTDRVPIVGLTAHAGKRERERLLKAGMDDCLAKPIEMADLVAVLERNVPAGAGQLGRSALEVRPVPAPQPPPVEQQGEPRIVDEAVLLDHVGGDRELIRELAEMFAAERLGILEDLAAAASRDDAENLEKTAHKLRSTFSALAAKPALEVALQIEELGKKGQLGGIETMLASLEREMSRIERDLTMIAGMQRL